MEKNLKISNDFAATVRRHQLYDAIELAQSVLDGLIGNGDTHSAAYFSALQDVRDARAAFNQTNDEQ